MRRIGGAVGGLLVALVIFVLLGEVLARATNILDRLNGYTHLLYAPGPDPDLPYVLRPGMETTLRGIPIRIDSLGLRGPEVAAAPAPGVHRVVILGDSVVFGQEMPEDATLSADLQRRLDALGAGPTEVLNLGVSGYDSVSELRFLEAVGLPLHPETVVVGVSLNDHDVTPQLGPFGVMVRKDLDDRAPDLLDRSAFLTVLRWMARWLRGDLFVQLAARAESQQAGPPGAPPPAFNSPGMVAAVRDLRLRFYHDPVPAYWDRMRGALAGFGRVAREHHLRLLIAIFPESYQVGVPDPDLTPQRRIMAACADAGLPCLDLQPAFARAGGDLFADVSHPNAAGHAVAADAIASALTGRGEVAREPQPGDVVLRDALDANHDERLAGAGPAPIAQSVDPAPIVDRDGDGRLVIACIGDSNTAARWPTPDVVRWCEMAAPRLAAVAARCPAWPTPVWRDVALGGATVTRPREPWAWGPLFVDRARAQGAELLLASFGTNDLGRQRRAPTQVAAGYAKLVLYARPLPVVVALTPPFVDAGGHVPGSIATANGLLRAQLPADRILDFATGFGVGDLEPDGVHLTAAAQSRRADVAVALLTRLLTEAFGSCAAV